MFNQAKLIGIGIAVILIISSIGGAVWYYKWSQQEMEILNANNAILTTAIESSESAVASLKDDAVQNTATTKKLDKEYRAARDENNALRTKLSRHNISYLAYRKPEWVGKILTKGTADAERCFEILSGDELTEAEIAATKKSEANTSCPRLANPNYEVPE